MHFSFYDIDFLQEVLFFKILLTILWVLISIFTKERKKREITVVVFVKSENFSSWNTQ